LVEITLAAEKLDERGMVYDFTIIKQVMAIHSTCWTRTRRPRRLLG
jgi:6-pyruvoyl-tetrahydropterin synthase